MANLLVWWSPTGAELEDELWAQMVGRLLSDSPPCDPSTVADRRGRGFRAFACNTFHGEPAPLRDLGDALVLASLRHDLQDAEFFGQVYAEPAAIIRLHRSGDRLSISRDMLGHRTLVWARVPSGVLISTSEEPLLLHPKVGAALDEDHIAAVLAYVPPADDSTPFLNIRALPSGATMAFHENRQQLFRGCFDPCEDVGGLSDRQLADRFRGLLEESVQRSMRGARRVGISLSSGLDAASIAVIVARSRFGAGVPYAVTYGWSRAEGADADERIPAGALAKSLGFDFRAIDARQIQLDFTMDSPWTGALGLVTENPYREIKTEVYRCMESAGVDVMLAGHGADQFALHPAHWLWSAWKDRRWDWISAGLKRYRAERGTLGTLRHPALRRFAKYLLVGQRRLASMRAPETMPVRFQSAWREQRVAEAARFNHWPDPARCAALLNWMESADYAFEARFSERYGVDLRCPFRDWKLTQFVLSTPTYLMSGPAGYKWMLKQAARDALDEAWLARSKCGDLSPLWRAHHQRRQEDIRTALRASRQFLERFTSCDPERKHADSSDEVRMLALRSWHLAACGMTPIVPDGLRYRVGFG